MENDNGRERFIASQIKCSIWTVTFSHIYFRKKNVLIILFFFNCSGPNDNVFVYFSDHGATDLIGFPSAEVTITLTLSRLSLSLFLMNKLMANLFYVYVHCYFVFFAVLDTNEKTE